ncbi:hypothetical protein MUK42_36123 [Musa troglodytarum]|uniref:Uncharacterized protein n=1 Tax=Musa troglodytarum TaxID=320322 RepID=A0A9E7KRV2_9LILI|nr:hypothetical protein MUK42_36123 [Musa troglodytarum]
MQQPAGASVVRTKGAKRSMGPVEAGRRWRRKTNPWHIFGDVVRGPLYVRMSGWNVTTVVRLVVCSWPAASDLAWSDPPRPFKFEDQFHA